MKRTILLLIVNVTLGAGGLSFAQLHNHNQHGEHVKVLSSHDIQEKLDGNQAGVTVVEVTLEAGQAGEAHRHPGPGFVYVLEGEYELGIDDQPTKLYKAGQTFYEPTGCLHRVSRNPSAKGRTRLIAVVLHPRGVKEIAVPEQKQE